MAKSPNGLGKFSGKVGAVVFSVSNGQQVVRGYQPIVNNPKSSLQRLQRAKANLVGRLSAITPWQILAGLGSSRKSQRSRFLRLAMNATTASFSNSDPSIILAKLADNAFVFSEGALLPAIFLGNPSASALSVSFTVQQTPGSLQSDFLASGALAVVVIQSVDGRYESVLYRFISAAEIAEAEGGILSIRMEHINEGGYYADFYLAPFKTDDGTSLRAKSQSLFGSETDFNAQMVYNPSALPLVWGASHLVGSATFTPA